MKVTFFSMDKNVWLSLRVKSIDEPLNGFQSFVLRVNVGGSYFRGSLATRIELTQWHQFVTELQACEKSRKGFASFSSISPGDFSLIIKQADGLGHFCIDYEMKRVFPVISTTHEQSHAGGFDIDMEHFAQSVLHIEQLVVI